MAKKKSLLVSIDFRVSSGGISRVAHLMDQALDFDFIFSLYGQSESKNSQHTFYDGNRFLFVFNLLKKIFVSRFDIIVFDHLGVASVLLFIPVIFLRKVVIFLHDEEAWVKVTGRQRVALQKAQILLTNSSYTFQFFIKNNPAFQYKTKVCLLGGVPKVFEDVIPSLSSEYDKWFISNHPFIVFVSRLWKKHRYKGHWELLEAYKQLNEVSNYSLRLAIIGRGDDAEDIQRFIKSNNLTGKVALFTNVNDADLAFFYHRSSGLIFPSIREGFGLVFLEAMFFKKAAIGILDQPAEEIIIHNKTGLLLNDNSPETLVKTLVFLNSNTTLLKAWGENAYDHFALNFTKDRFIQRFLKLIE